MLIKSGMNPRLRALNRINSTNGKHRVVHKRKIHNPITSYLPFCFIIAGNINSAKQQNTKPLIYARKVFSQMYRISREYPENPNNTR